MFDMENPSCLIVVYIFFLRYNTLQMIAFLETALVVIVGLVYFLNKIETLCL